MEKPNAPPLRMFAVVVGIDRYCDKRIPPLGSAVIDAQRIAAFLKQGNPAFTLKKIQPLKNEQATAKAIIDTLDDLWNQEIPTPRDILLFYFAGHGLVTASLDTPQGLLCGYGAAKQDPIKGSLSLDTLFQKIIAVKCGHVMVIIDACYSGALNDPGIIMHQPAAAMRSALKQIQPQTAQGHRILLTAAHSTEAAWEQHGGGVFTNALLDGWQDGAAERDGILTPNQLSDFIQRQFKDNHRQQPVCATVGDGVLVLGRYTEHPVVSRQDAIVTPGSLGVTGPVIAPERRTIVMISTVIIIVLTALGVLVVTSATAFVVTCALALLCAFLVPLAIPVARSVTSLLALAEAVLLAGVIHNRFGVLANVTVLDALARLGWLALLLGIGQVLAIVVYGAYRATSN